MVRKGSAHSFGEAPHDSSLEAALVGFRGYRQERDARTLIGSPLSLMSKIGTKLMSLLDLRSTLVGACKGKVGFGDKLEHDVELDLEITISKSMSVELDIKEQLEYNANTIHLDTNSDVELQLDLVSLM